MRVPARPFPSPDYAFLQAERNDSLVAQAPHLPLRIPTPAGLPDLLLQRPLISANAYRHQRVWRGLRLPDCLFHDQLDRFIAALLLGVVAVTDAKQSIAVLLDESFGAVLPRNESQSRAHHQAGVSTLIMWIWLTPV